MASQMELDRDVENFLHLDRKFDLLTYSASPSTVLPPLVHRF